MYGIMGDNNIRSFLLVCVLVLTISLMAVLAYGWLFLRDDNARTALVGAFGSLVSVVVYFVHGSAARDNGSAIK